MAFTTDRARELAAFWEEPIEYGCACNGRDDPPSEDSGFLCQLHDGEMLRLVTIRYLREIAEAIDAEADSEKQEK